MRGPLSSQLSRLRAEVRQLESLVILARSGDIVGHQAALGLLCVDPHSSSPARNTLFIFPPLQPTRLLQQL